MTSPSVPFNRPVYIEDSLRSIRKIVRSNQQINIAGDGKFCQMCEKHLEQMYSESKVLLTTSCTHALEMAALLTDVKKGDVVIAPSYTFVSTVLPFESRGASIRFVDVDPKTGNLDINHLLKIIDKKVKIIITVHYAGHSTDMSRLVDLCNQNDIVLIEDAAQAIGATYNGKLLGTFGDLSTLSFHETKNVTSGEGGALIINNEKYLDRAKIIREKGTNRSQFLEGLVDKYSWVDTGSSYILSDLNAAYLYPQLVNLLKINKKRLKVIKTYKENIHLPKDVFFLQTPDHNDSNGHLCAIVCKNNAQRKKFIAWMKESGITTPFHYISLHTSPYMLEKNSVSLPSTDKLSKCLVRLPLFYAIKRTEVKYVCDKVNEFFESDLA